jgi:hypothetical protein
VFLVIGTPVTGEGKLDAPGFNLQFDRAKAELLGSSKKLQEKIRAAK